MTQASKYHLEQQYNLVFACACIHNINVIRNSANDIIFQQEEAEPSNKHTKAPQINDEIPTGCYSSNREREECENWRDSIASGLWDQYVSTLQRWQA
jgi:hypothetical protein